MSKLNDIMDAIVAKEVAADERIGPNRLTVVKRKLPKREETDLAYQVTVSPVDTGERVVRIAFGANYKVTYGVDITLITPNDHDALQYLPEHLAWRENVRARYMALTPLPGLGIAQIDLDTGPLFDRPAMADGYDYQTVALAIVVYEDR